MDYANKMMCFIDEKGNIFSVDVLNKNQTCIGVNLDVYNKMKEISEIASSQAFKFNEEKNNLLEERDKYYSLLIEHGILTKPKTQEEINTELLKKNEALERKLEMILDALAPKVGGVVNVESEAINGTGEKVRV